MTRTQELADLQRQLRTLARTWALDRPLTECPPDWPVDLIANQLIELEDRIKLLEQSQEQA